MGQIHHGSAPTTHAVRAEIQQSQDSTAELSRKLGINPKAVAKCCKRRSAEEQKIRPKYPYSALLNEEEEAMIAAFRQQTFLQKSEACLPERLPSINRTKRCRSSFSNGVGMSLIILQSLKQKSNLSGIPSIYILMETL